ncbi:SDR family oxidoreductase [Telmatocola sphagniphila]|nr:SDR family oxidoreductase [Telmatocola sphagniphila]
MKILQPPSGYNSGMANLIIGCGYLGRSVARLWLEAKQEVYALTRSAGSELPAGTQPITGDVTQPQSLSKLGSQSWDTLLYAVGLDRKSGRSFREVYIDGLRNVLEKLPPGGKFLYVSSTSVYGQTTGEWVNEASDTSPLEENGKIVREAELLLHSYRPEAVILRFAGIYGPGRLLRRTSIEKGEVLVCNPDKWLNLIHREDGARAILLAQTSAQAGQIYLISDGQPVRRPDFYSFLAEQLNAPTVRFQSPPAGVPQPPHEMGNRRIENRKARQELGFEPQFANYRSGIAASLTAEVES